jgi:hypothetical protein
MSISVKWHNQDKTELYTHFQDPWTLEEFIDIRKNWYRMIKSVDRLVPIIMDFSKTHNPPQGILRQFIAIHRTPHPRQGYLIVVGLNSVFQKLSKHLIDGTTSPEKKMYLVSSIDQALEICNGSSHTTMDDN